MEKSTRGNATAHQTEVRSGGKAAEGRQGLSQGSTSGSCCVG